MKLLRFVPIKLTIFLVLGILLGSLLDFRILPSLTMTLIFILVLGLVFLKERSRKGVVFGITTALLTISMGMLSFALSNPFNVRNHYAKKGVQTEGNWRLKIREVLKPTSFSKRYLANVISLEGEKVSGKILLNQSINATHLQLQVDDELVIYTSAAPIYPALNPHQFDYQKYMQGLGVTDQIQLVEENYILETNSATTIYGAAAATRNKIITKLKKANFGEDELDIIQALLLGQRNDISADTYNDYKNAGAVHILAVSGLHIGVLLLLLQFLFRPLEILPHGKKFKLAVIVILLWGFAFLAGLSASIIRAVTMFTFVAYALYLNRPSNTFNILALSMFFILLVFDAKLLFQVGFQMSYAAVFAIVWIYPLLQKFWSPKNIIFNKIWQLLAVSIAAQMGVLPISLFYFHQFPGLFFISNLLIVPALGVILGLGVLVIVLSILNILPDLLVAIYNTLISWMNSVIGWVADQESFIFRDIPFDGVQLILAYALLISLVLFCSKANFKRSLTLGSCIIVFQLYAFFAEFQSGQKETLILAHQSKNSVLIQRTGDNLQIMTRDSIRTERLVKDYEVAERIDSVKFHSLRNIYDLGEKKLLIMDSLAIYPPNKKSMEYVLLTQSPKVNLKRLLDSIRPHQIIADGSNYKSYIERWKQSCMKRKIPFHYTGEKGAYYFPLND
jgi:competence protein ComEC